MAMWPTEHDEIPKGYTGFMLILDEFNSASLAVQTAAYKVVLDRCIGQVKLHSKTAILCIGNLETDNAIVNRMSTAMQSRLVHLQLAVDAQIWLDGWAIKNGIDHRIAAFISRYPEKLFNFKPDHDDKTFATCRTWHFVSRLIASCKTDISEMLPVIAGTIGEGMGREFVMFTAIYKDLPTMQQIENDPENTPMSDEPSMLWALSHFISSHVTEDSMSQVMKYITRMPVEFEVITLQNTLRKDATLISLPCIQDYIERKGAELF